MQHFGVKCSIPKSYNAQIDVPWSVSNPHRHNTLHAATLLAREYYTAARLLYNVQVRRFGA
jgi:hypothetical protein